MDNEDTRVSYEQRLQNRIDFLLDECVALNENIQYRDNVIRSLNEEIIQATNVIEDLEEEKRILAKKVEELKMCTVQEAANE